MRKDGDQIRGWISPDNPAISPVAVIKFRDGSTFELATNEHRSDVKEHGMHHSGDVGFVINGTVVPGLNVDDVEILDKHTSILLYRPLKPETHLPVRLCRFDMQAMPHAAAEAKWDSSFNLYYNAIEQYPLDTMYGILNRPGSIESIGLSGRFSVFKYDHLLRQAGYKLIALLRDPIEELAERLLFVRYATSSDKYELFRSYLTGLEGLAIAARRLDLSEPETISEAFAYIPDKQKEELANPLTRALGCNVNEDPTELNIEVALTRLSAFDLVGIRSQYEKFKSGLLALLGRDVLGDVNPVTITEASRLAVQLQKLPIIQKYTKLDTRLYQYVQTAIDRATNDDAGLDESTVQELMQTTGTMLRKHRDEQSLR